MPKETLTPNTVSYTHLDVYKRQTPGFLVRWMAREAVSSWLASRLPAPRNTRGADRGTLCAGVLAGRREGEGRSEEKGVGGGPDRTAGV